MAATTIVPKSMPQSSTGEFDREAVLERLFALPIPPHRWGRRDYPIHTPLGRVMRVKEMLIRQVSAMPGCPNERRMSDYLAGRREIAPHHRGHLAAALGVDPRVL